MERNFVLKGDLCYSLDSHTLRTVQGGYLVCQDGQSAGAFETLPEQYQGYPLRDYGDRLLLPGLVDLHVHAPQFSFRGLGMDLELLDWLNTHTFPEEAKYSSLAYAKGAYAAFVEDLRRGPNTRAVVFATLHAPATLLLMDMLEASGLCTWVGKVNMDRNGAPGLQEADAAASLAATRDWLAQAQGRFQHTAPILTPRFIPSCTGALLEGIAGLQRETGLPVQSHMSENQSECGWVRELCPGAESYGDAYLGYGLFGGEVPTVMAHCCWLEEAEIVTMAKRRVHVAHCPQSNANLSSGIAPVRRLLEAGVPVGLGSDVAGGCHTSIFRAMGDAIQASKLRWRLVSQQEKPLTLPEAFHMATLGGGSFLGKVGSFAPGYDLDVIVVDDRPLAPPFPLSIEDRLARVVSLSDDRHIVSKYVQGRHILQKEGGAQRP